MEAVVVLEDMSATGPAGFFARVPGLREMRAYGETEQQAQDRVRQALVDHLGRQPQAAVLSNPCCKMVEIEL
jgi:hypothetical protein